MRTIKFRAWDNRTETWATDIKYQLFFNLETKPNGKFYIHDNSETGHDDYCLEQYTGLKDKNNVEIYEGDICLFKDYHTGVKYIKGKKKPLYKWDMIGVVEWYENINPCPMFKFNIVNGNYFNNWCYLKEVIGNIHENPELLEAK